jgi:hypothetical protein
MAVATDKPMGILEKVTDPIFPPVFAGRPSPFVVSFKGGHMGGLKGVVKKSPVSALCLFSTWAVLLLVFLRNGLMSFSVFDMAEK